MQSDSCDSEVAVSWENTDLIPGDGAGCCTVERTYTWVDDCGTNDVHSSSDHHGVPTT